jgi:hypothetical protein
MLQLLDFSGEILQQIVKTLSESFLPLEPDMALYRLSRTCRMFFDITEPYLHRKFVWFEKKKIRQFLRFVLENPRCASKVKILLLDQGKDYSAMEYSDDWRYDSNASGEEDSVLDGSEYEEESEDEDGSEREETDLIMAQNNTVV